MIKKIEIKPIDLAFEKITEKKDCYIELHDDYCIIKIHFHAEQGVEDPTVEPEDESWKDKIIWTTKYVNCTSIIKRLAISSIDIQYINDAWGIFILVMGVSSATGIYYKKEEDAQKTLQEIMNWWLGK